MQNETIIHDSCISWTLYNTLWFHQNRVGFFFQNIYNRHPLGWDMWCLGSWEYGMCPVSVFCLLHAISCCICNILIVFYNGIPLPLSCRHNQTVQTVYHLIIENLWKFYCYLDFNHPIRPQFCTCHDSWAVMTCAKLWLDLIIIFHATYNNIVRLGFWIPTYNSIIRLGYWILNSFCDMVPVNPSFPQLLINKCWCQWLLWMM